jgi:DNA mismatch repair protein MutS
MPAVETPLWRQYRGLKERYPDALLFFRLGDFYELFGDDARRAAPVLELVLTQRQGVPMCGLPHHALAGYLSRILKRGWRAAIAEQTEDPALTKGMVNREVVRLVTPGTVIEEELLAAKDNNFLLSLWPVTERRRVFCGFAAFDMSTGDLLYGVVEDGAGSSDRLLGEIARLAPKEILWPAGTVPPAVDRPVTPLDGAAFHSASARRAVESLLDGARLEGLGLSDNHPALPALGAVLAYIEKTQPSAREGVKPPRPHPVGDYLLLDERALARLDLLPDPSRPSIDGRPACLWEVLDHTATPMGGRRLKWWLLHPLLDLPTIHARQDRVEFLVRESAQRRELARLLGDMADMERILSRLTAGGATGRDMNALRRTLRRLPEVSALFDGAGDWAGEPPLAPLIRALNVPADLTDLLARALADDPPFKLSEGGVIRDGFSSDLDELRGFAKNGRAWISALETEERARTGIGSLKIGYTSVFGYYLEVSRANLAKVPAAWIRKQTLANAERYVTPELKAQEDKILGADEKSRALEAELFTQLRRDVLRHAPALRSAAEALAELDALASLAEAATRGRWTRPVVNEGLDLRLEKARHPVVERALDSAGAPFVPNDARMDDARVLLITGPNMGGKSTYLRQTALAVILAQMGSFVPAESAEIGRVDRIFTRIGAGDNLAAGASTFLVEMQEVATILRHATERSLVILDEVGRGTSTYDGVAVAGAVIEHLLGRFERPPRTLFATHYFELTALAERFPALRNFHASVREWTRPDGKTELVFLHQIDPGPADRSYGVHVAQMAGLPADCVARARRILADLESGRPASSAPSAGPRQRELIEAHPIVREIEGLTPDGLTPLEALRLIDRWRRELQEGVNTATTPSP